MRRGRVRWRGWPGPGTVPGVACAALLLLACGAGGEAGEDADASAATPMTDAAARGTTARGTTAQDTSSEVAAAGESGAAADPSDPGTVRITVGGHPVTVEVADEDDERQRGLMFRESLPEDAGMLFVYETERRLSFWMRNTLIPLDVAFIDRGGRIVDIQQMEAMTDDTHTSRAPALYALEMRLGWFEDHGVEVGDRVEF